MAETPTITRYHVLRKRKYAPREVTHIDDDRKHGRMWMRCSTHGTEPEARAAAFKLALDTEAASAFTGDVRVAREDIYLTPVLDCDEASVKSALMDFGKARAA